MIPGPHVPRRPGKPGDRRIDRAQGGKIRQSRAETWPLLYDEDCGFCKWSLEKLLAWDRAHRLRPVAIQSAEGEDLLAGMSEDERLASWHLILPSGEVRSGGAAAEPLARLLPGGRPLAALFAACPRATERAYRWVAEHRSALGRVLGSDRDRPSRP